MNRKNQPLRTGIAALLAAVMAGSATQVMLSALGLPCGVAAAYLPATVAALMCFAASLSGALAVAATAMAVALGAITAATHIDGFTALGQWFAAFGAQAALEDSVRAGASGVLAALAGILLAALSFVLIDRGGTPFALLTTFAAMIVSYALAEEMSFAPAVPGLIAALAAMACSGEVQRDASAWRVLIPACLAVALAVMLVPGQRLTWEPLETLARRIRATVEDYFRFTAERVPFTISTEGYNHAAEEDGLYVAKLGGPATPDAEPVLEVTSDADVLLRGSIRRTYTGSSWLDTDSKARYLYYDFTRARVRERVFNMSGNEAFRKVNVSVKALSERTSTLFVPGRMEEFSMNLDTAVYYNSIGELFLSRSLAPGDAYSLTGFVADDADALREAVLAARTREDPDFDELQRSCTQLPEGIEEGVYALAMELTRDADNAYDKAAAIESWLKNHCEYTLEPSVPDDGRDFVSQFLLGERRGYCSYFASAMTVLCRIAGLPARYVEGYQAPAGTGVILTGEDAHAWTEVYFNGVGWVVFDPANGGRGGEDGLSGDDSSQSAEGEATSPPPGSDLSPTPTPTLPAPDGGGATPSPESPSPSPESGEPTSTPEPDGAATDPTPTPSDAPEDPPPDGNPDRRGLAWLWILLIVLLLILLAALAALWVRRRLAQTDPILLSSRAKTAQQAALILYRSILTLLAQTGQAPLSGETPGAFARRVCAQTRNPDFIAFADALAASVYARKGVGRETVRAGHMAYATFVDGLRRGERVRFALTRMFKGLGAFEHIP